jgi:ferrochelatase
VGTPDAPDPSSVRRYLREFLSDPRVIDIAAPLRWMLLNFVILPRRPRQSAAAYAKVWGPKGSPLRFHSQDFAAALGTELGPGYGVALGMRYGNPSLESAYASLIEAGAEQIVVFPLYPQRAASSTGTSLDAVYRLAAAAWCPPALHIVNSFYGDDGFLDAAALVARPILDAETPDHVLFSFHGLPERHMRKSDPTVAHCLASPDCCAVLRDVNRGCYRAQCYHTAGRLAGKLALPDGEWSVSFQSRLGRTPWIKPYTDERLPELVAAGCRRLVVVCPAFVADCLETLEEIGMRAQDDFIAAGGESLTLVPAVNASPDWIKAAANLVLRAAPGTV